MSAPNKPIGYGVSPSILGDRKIHLHLGAHKTATTYVQENLAKNIPALLKQGVLYLSIEETRKKLTKSISMLSKAARSSPVLARHRQMVLDGFGCERLERCHTILISEENLPTTPGIFVRGFGYSKLGDNLKYLRDELGSNISVFFSIRNYPDFLASMYSETIRNRPYFSFKDFVEPNNNYQDLWPKTYEQLAQIFGESNVTLWDFQDTVTRPHDVLAMLTGVDTPLVIEKTPVRESLSHRAIEFIGDFQKMRPASPVKPQFVSKAAAILYPVSDQNGKFDPWTPEERAILHANYIEQKNMLPIKHFVSKKA